ncbi:hypothetical protein BP6252_04191 [Coleophoma cylindrospora]|uniref:Uncharacterized protein n=1 Tax=Coleophoma cylindrospora TaxID=1849047 RepID=A0A3D8RZS3_9HELO|nr:hypothetical protein BP6252_04191 [Coleophoma cylindrospora]
MPFPRTSTPRAVLLSKPQQYSIIRSGMQNVRNQQSRTYRIAIWSSHFGGGHRKGKNCRDRVLQERYADVLPWKSLMAKSVNRVHAQDLLQKINNKKTLVESIASAKVAQWLTQYEKASMATLNPKVFTRYSKSDKVESSDEEYRIDPITNRRVPKKTPTGQSDASEGANIPVDRAKQRHSFISDAHTTTKWGTCRTFPKSTIDNPSPEELASYGTPFWHKEPEEWHGKKISEPDQTGNPGIEHRTKADQDNLMQYEEEYRVDYSKGFYHDEPLEWYPRRLSKKDKAAKRADLEKEYERMVETMKRDDEIIARRMPHYEEAEEFRRRRNADEAAGKIHAQMVQDSEAEKASRSVIHAIQNADEIHAQMVQNSEAEQASRSAIHAIQNADDIHAQMVQDSEAEQASRSAIHAIQNADEIHARHIANAKAERESRPAIQAIQRADDIHERHSANIQAEQKARSLQDLTIENSELQNHAAHLQGKVDNKIAEFESETPAFVPSGKRMTGNYARDFPEEFQETWTTKENEHAFQSRQIDSAEPTQQKITGEQNDFILGRAPKEAFSRDSRTPRLETSLDRSAASSVVVSELDPVEKAKNDAVLRKLQEENDPYSKEPMGLETAYKKECAVYGISHLPLYVNSFPKEQAAEKEPTASIQTPKTETEEVDENGYTTKPMGLEVSYEKECEREGKTPGEFACSTYTDPVSSSEMLSARESITASTRGSTENSGVNTTQENFMQQARDIRAEKAAKKEDLKKLVRNIRDIYESTYGTIDSKHRQISGAEKSASSVISSNLPGTQEEPNLYKILAYDPTMQTINTAEATSIVSDTAAPLTPAEVLLRLSNPSKFFPHFGPLQAQGYEIVSGSGDVLVFRKVRAATPEDSQIGKTRKKVVNPIDGTESRPMVATGNFASPTGFVNHDMPVDPSFKSNIDVRREEPVFSGTKSTWSVTADSKKRKSKGHAKRLLLGAFWVGACSYAVGVVSEFFRTGGIDGRGPVGF